MWNSTGIPRRYLGRIFFAGVRDFEAVRRCGFEPFATVEEAVAAASPFSARADASITLCGTAGIPLRYLGRIFFAGVRDFEVASEALRLRA